MGVENAKHVCRYAYRASVPKRHESIVVIKHCVAYLRQLFLPDFGVCVSTIVARRCTATNLKFSEHGSLLADIDSRTILNAILLGLQ